ncbi:hypothetical protein LMH87_011438 [Akanthomyces muscarius]|uniref:Sodium/calcium exchanger membrane region domain-containing protein n=1 Tax=Akanthomyces muscarius TaxID=2231603 RepID=A0A9W8Q9R8_AKAMU|nr:hypothetical protein LMH87_011438 [Akanthomyces muscarius]KAJ4150701.1 hypothetical protein LMH87_011438 [Akanthomyces muscarius]
MATADTFSTSPTTTNSRDISQQHEQQHPTSPVLALRFPAVYDTIDTACHDAKTGGHDQPRGGLAQVFTDAYHDILRTWMGLHRSFGEPAAATSRRGRTTDYHTFTQQYDSDNSSSSSSAAYCGGARYAVSNSSNASAFAAEVGDMVLGPYINGLLVCVPVGVAAYRAAAPSLVVFAVNALAIVPLSSLLTDATERIAFEAGDAVGAFLNISLGNIVELILFVTLINGHVRIVQASILGSILVNLLPILGSALVAAHATAGDDSLASTETQMLACLLFVSVFIFMIPTAFTFTFRDTHRNINDMVVDMSRASAILILFMYVAYFLHTMQSSSSRAPDEEEDDAAQLRTPITPPPLLRRTSPPPTPGPRTLRFADSTKTEPTSNLYARRVFEIGPASVDSDRADEEPSRGRSPTVSSPLLPFAPRMRRWRSRSLSAGSSCSRASSGMSRGWPQQQRSFARAGLARVLSNDRRAGAASEQEDEILHAPSDHGKLGAVAASVTILLLASILLAVSARLLAGTLDAVTRRRGLSEAVIGLIILPLAGNLSGYLTVVAVAARDNLDLAAAVSAGSAIQIALCVAPLTVLAGWALGRPVTLALDVLEMAMLLGAVSLVNLLVLGGGGRGSDGRRATGLKGGILCACFLVMGIAAFFAPNDS